MSTLATTFAHTLLSTTLSTSALTGSIPLLMEDVSTPIDTPTIQISSVAAVPNLPAEAANPAEAKVAPLISSLWRDMPSTARTELQLAFDSADLPSAEQTSSSRMLGEIEPSFIGSDLPMAVSVGFIAFSVLYFAIDIGMRIHALGTEDDYKRDPKRVAILNEGRLDHADSLLKSLMREKTKIFKNYDDDVLREYSESEISGRLRLCDEIAGILRLYEGPLPQDWQNVLNEMPKTLQFFANANTFFRVSYIASQCQRWWQSFPQNNRSEIRAAMQFVTALPDQLYGFNNVAALKSKLSLLLDAADEPRS